MIRILPNDIVSDENVGISKMSITYTQNPDTNSDTEEDQYITIETSMSSTKCDYNEGDELPCYFNISMPDGRHWSVEDESELVALFNDFKKRFSIVTGCTKIKNN